jgi:hypothetical protein
MTDPHAEIRDRLRRAREAMDAGDYELAGAILGPADPELVAIIEEAVHRLADRVREKHARPALRVLP